MKNYISPTYAHEKLDDPGFDDLVDVFEDRVRGWLVEPCEMLLKSEQGWFPAMSLALTYFEAIEVYLSGKDSKGSSKKHFVKGFTAVFKTQDGDTDGLANIAKTVYEEGRCGFFHDGVSGRRICYSIARRDALLVTVPRRKGRLDSKGEVQSIVINPVRFLWCVKRHFDKYISNLRNRDNADVRERFRMAVDLKWCLGDVEPVMGMTEEEFLSRKLPMTGRNR